MKYSIENYVFQIVSQTLDGFPTTSRNFLMINEIIIFLFKKTLTKPTVKMPVSISVTVATLFLNLSRYLCTGAAVKQPF